MKHLFVMVTFCAAGCATEPTELRGDQQAAFAELGLETATQLDEHAMTFDCGGTSVELVRDDGNAPWRLVGDAGASDRCRRAFEAARILVSDIQPVVTSEPPAMMAACHSESTWIVGTGNCGGCLHYLGDCTANQDLSTSCSNGYATTSCSLTCCGGHAVAYAGGTVN